MLNKKHRLHRGEDFRRVLSRGKKHRTPLGLVAVSASAAEVTRFGFVVSKAVGNAVVRNRVKRRLRAASAAFINLSPPLEVVVRARSGCDQVSVDETRRVFANILGTTR